MATAAILKKSTLKKHNFTLHMIFLQGFIKFDQGISEKCVGQTFDGRKKERIIIIIIIIRNGANTICLPNFVWEP
jgi:hypothetical protein